MQTIEFISECEIGAGGDEDNSERAAQISGMVALK
jgi:hypothetical protein